MHYYYKSSPLPPEPVIQNKAATNLKDGEAERLAANKKHFPKVVSIDTSFRDVTFW